MFIFMMNMNENIVIRRLAEEDAGEYLSFAQKIIAEGIYSITVPSEFNMDLDEERTWIRDVVRNENNVCLVAVLDGRHIIGNVNILQERKVKLAHNSELTVSVAEEYRGQRIGTRLLAGALEELAERNVVRQLYLNVLGDNFRAIKLYMDFGFVERGRIPDYVCHRGKFIDLVTMSRKNGAV